jgi:hypothetical protein
VRAAAFLDGRELRINLTVTVLGVPIKVAGTVEVFDVRREAS